MNLIYTLQGTNSSIIWLKEVHKLQDIRFVEPKRLILKTKRACICSSKPSFSSWNHFFTKPDKACASALFVIDNKKRKIDSPRKLYKDVKPKSVLIHWTKWRRFNLWRSNLWNQSRIFDFYNPSRATLTSLNTHESTKF